MTSSDKFNLQRFVDAQGSDISSVLVELRDGEKVGHWMWYIFPQLRGLGQSAVAHRYGITSCDEARAYSDHPVLGVRLRECTEAVLSVEGRSLFEVFDSPDDIKFRSSMTLFSVCGAQPTIFRRALTLFCAGEPDSLTIQLLNEKRNR